MVCVCSMFMRCVCIGMCVYGVYKWCIRAYVCMHLCMRHMYMTPMNICDIYMWKSMCHSTWSCHDMCGGQRRYFGSCFLFCYRISLLSATWSHTQSRLAGHEFSMSPPFLPHVSVGELGFPSHSTTSIIKNASFRSELRSSACVANAFTTEHLRAPLIHFDIH